MKIKRLLLIAILPTLFVVGCDTITYTISFDSNGGSIIDPITTDGKSLIEIPPDPIKEGFSFSGWYWDNETFQTPFVANSFLDETISSNMTVYAKWVIQDVIVEAFKVNFETDGGYEVESINVQKGNTIPLATTFKKGYTLEGWYTSLNGGQTLDEKWSFATSTVNNDMTLYANWTINTYSINYCIVDQYNFLNDSIVSVSLGQNRSSAITTSGRLFLWGNSSGRVYWWRNSDCNLLPIDITSQFNLASGETITSVSFGSEHASALTSSGRLFMWGSNYHGQLGYGTETDCSTPIDITSQFHLTAGETIAGVSLGSYYSSALTSLGRLFMWGSNYYGQLGNGTSIDSLIPIEITSQFNLKEGESLVSVSLEGDRSSALTSSGRLFMWGYNLHGQLGNGTQTDSSTPIEITCKFNLTTGETIASVSLGVNHSSAITSSGRIFVWGYNGFGQLGNGTFIDSSAPIEITGQFNLSSGERIVSLSLGNDHSSALTSSGRFFMWGWNGSGQLGTTISGLTPIEITSQFNLTSGETIVTVTLGGMHSSALTSSGNFFIWGNNYEGQLGNGTTTDSPTPILIQSAARDTFEITQTYGTIITPYTPIKEGYTFSGWFTDKIMTHPYTFGTVPANTLNLYGYWILNN